MRDIEKNLQGKEVASTRIDSDDWFGKDKTVHVKLLEHTDTLQALHELIVDVLEKYEVQFNTPEHIRQGFKPHSTVQKTGQARTGDIVDFDTLTLIDMFPDENPYRRRVLQTIRLR